MKEKIEKKVKELRKQKEALKREYHEENSNKEYIIRKIEEINTIIYEIESLL